MARINMEVIVDDLDNNFARVLKAVVDEIAPDMVLMSGRL